MNYSLLDIQETTTFITADMLLKIGNNRVTTADAVASDLQLTENCFILEAPMSLCIKFATMLLLEVALIFWNVLLHLV